MRNTKVWVPNYAGHNYTGAATYGEITSLTQGYVSFESLDRLKYELFKTIATQTNDDDWICVSGLQALSVMCCVLWYAHWGKIKLLIWDKKNPNVYRELVIDDANVDKMLTELGHEYNAA